MNISTFYKRIRILPIFKTLRLPKIKVYADHEDFLHNFLTINPDQESIVWQIFRCHLARPPFKIHIVWQLCMRYMIYHFMNRANKSNIFMASYQSTRIK